ncbi:hypothetical protein [Aquimarina brevivitae]|uniref:Uncharacterized protein n=1 Tax=Aquimarina brevivitae TaxID=323412 RepID=A0A4Q7P4E8_9FLAO|nr:hypothetical protein [Aquimarina brevivitae]RZS93562.1 hypothetical protein EV197_2142 [Aquimarina brevivitae]
MRTYFTIIIFVSFFTSCTPYLNIINETESTIKAIAILGEEEQSNFELGYEDIIKQNVLTKPLTPQEGIIL